MFAGMLAGLLVVSVFSPPVRDDLQVPTPGDRAPFRTGTGCVVFKTTEVACPDDATSLNILASKHK